MGLLDGSALEMSKGGRLVMLGGVSDGTACAVAVMSIHNYVKSEDRASGEASVIYIYVASGMRRQGIATALIGAMRELCVKLGLDKLTIRYGGDRDITAALDRILTGLDVQIKTDAVTNYTVTLGEVLSSPILSGMDSKLNSTYKAVREIASYYLIDMLATAARSEDPWYSYIRPGKYSETLSIGYLERNKLAGVVLVEDRDEYIEIGLLYSKSRNILVPLNMLARVAGVLKDIFARDKAYAGKSIRFSVADRKLIRLARRAFPTSEHTEVFFRHANLL